ncbi:hypothetical protein MTR67_044835 [Solanum verrucosum]|uniref:Uncharacterized protein n=1 Tax=Solanum verrucosum TaxID=315347 RepID=A0AAF0USW5_SOLVR|nr:hypothetical protein MTR67_044835 [Solanum verrucosum]
MINSFRLTNVDAIQFASKPSLKDAFHEKEKYILAKVYFHAYFKGFPSSCYTFYPFLIPSRRASELSICIGLPDWLIRNHRLIVSLSRKNGRDKIQRCSFNDLFDIPEYLGIFLLLPLFFGLKWTTKFSICNLESGTWNCNLQQSAIWSLELEMEEIKFEGSPQVNLISLKWMMKSF